MNAHLQTEEAFKILGNHHIWNKVLSFADPTTEKYYGGPKPKYSSPTDWYSTLLDTTADAVLKHIMVSTHTKIPKHRRSF